MSVPRSEGREVNHEIAQNDAKALYKAGQKRLGTDETVFIRIFSERSATHLAVVNHTYYNMYGNTLKKVCSLFFCLYIRWRTQRKVDFKKDSYLRL